MSVKRYTFVELAHIRQMGTEAFVDAADYDALAAKLQTAEAALHEICGESTESNIVKIAEIALGLYDPSPYCSGCGAMRKTDCHCGPLADNE
jgi:hypothetical protein